MMLGCKELVTCDVRKRNMEILTHDILQSDGLPLNISPGGGEGNYGIHKEMRSVIVGIYYKNL